MAGEFSEPTLIRLASGFEHVTHARRVPKFLPTLPVTSPSGASGEPGGGDGRRRVPGAGATAALGEAQPPLNSPALPLPARLGRVRVGAALASSERQ